MTTRARGGAVLAARLDARAPPWPANDPLFFGALLLHAAVAAVLPVTAWPEVTTPAYLVARGLGLYREIKFVHTPGLMEGLGLWFRLFGVSAASLRAFAGLCALGSHATLLHETRGEPVAARCWSSAFFVATFYAWHGSAIWPSVMIAVLAIPIARALARESWVTAGLLVGTAIAIKQTAAYLMFVVLAYLVMTRRVRGAARVAAAAVLPYLAAWALFAAAGSGWSFIEWTLLVPFGTLYGAINIAPTLPLALPILVAFLPLLAAALVEESGAETVSARIHLLVAAGLALMVYPRFGELQTVAAVPCLAVGAARALRLRGRLLAPATAALVAATTISTAAIPILGEAWDGTVVFWNDSPAFNAMVARVAQLPAGDPLVADVWENVLPRTGRLPPGRLYYHPWLSYFDPVDDDKARVDRAASRPGTISVSWGRQPPGIVVGPYVIRVRPPEGL